MEKKGKIILVLGATGQQGGAVVRSLLADGWNVRALVRDPNKPAAQDLARRGAELVKGDMEDRASLTQALQGVYGAFSVQQFWGLGAEGEVRQGKNVAEAAKTAGIQHVVYTSVASADRKTGISHFESKWQIEEQIRSLDIPATILRPVFFMDNFGTVASAPKLIDGVLTFSMPMKPTTKLQMVAVEDIGIFAARAFENPEEFIGKAIDLAGDELTIPAVADIFKKITGKQHRFIETPMDEVRKYNPEEAEMFEWFNAKGYTVDIPALRDIHPGLLSVEAWLRKAETQSQKTAA